MNVKIKVAVAILMTARQSLTEQILGDSLLALLERPATALEWATVLIAKEHPSLGNNRSLPSLARPSLLHRLDRKHSKIFVHPLGMRLDVCNGHTRS